MTAPSATYILNDRYELIERIGEPSGMGEVWRAHDPTLRRAVAIKTAANPALARRLVTEARNVAAVPHRYIVNVYDYGDWHLDGLPFPAIVMELIDGPALSQLVRNGQRVDPLQALRLTAEVLEALQWSHDHEIVHGDIKPANVLLAPQGHAKVVDFGIAVPMSERAERPASAAWENLFGTPPYAAPEQWGGVINAASDIWQCGAMLYELLTGEVPFARKPVDTLPQRIERGEYAIPDFVDDAVADVIRGAMQPGQADRFVSPDSMALAIDRAERTLLNALNVGTSVGTERIELQPQATPIVPPETAIDWVFPTRLESRLYVRSTDAAGTERWDFLGATAGTRPVPPSGDLLLEVATADIHSIEQVLFEIDEKRLRAVVLDHPDDRALALLANRMKGIRDLRMIGQLHGMDLTPLLQLYRLESLTMARTDIDDRDLAVISMLTSLRKLDVSGTRVSDAGHAAVAAALPLLSLQAP